MIVGECHKTNVSRPDGRLLVETNGVGSYFKQCSSGMGSFCRHVFFFIEFTGKVHNQAFEKMSSFRKQFKNDVFISPCGLKMALMHNNSTLLSH